VIQVRSQGESRDVGLLSYKVSLTIVTCHSGEWPVKYPGEADLYQTPGDTCAARSAGVVEPVFANIHCPEAHAPLHAPDQVESGCTMATVRSGPQSRQDPLIWGAPLTCGEAKHR
jgi:hypothetical protein